MPVWLPVWKSLTNPSSLCLKQHQEKVLWPVGLLSPPLLKEEDKPLVGYESKHKQDITFSVLIIRL